MAFYDAIPASDGTSLTAPSNAEFKVFEVTDTSRANPLELRTVAGMNAAPLITTAQGVVPPVEVVSPNFEHIFKSGEWEWRRESSEGIKLTVSAAAREARDASIAAQEAQAAAEDAARNSAAPADEAVSKALTTQGTAAHTYFAQALGAVTPENKARPVGKGEILINARDFGAKGDGVTDDTAALQAWLDAGGATLMDGVFKVTAPLILTGPRRELATSNATLAGGAPRITILRVAGPESTIRVHIDGRETASQGIKVTAPGCRITGCLIENLHDTVASARAIDVETNGGVEIDHNVIRNIHAKKPAGVTGPFINSRAITLVSTAPAIKPSVIHDNIIDGVTGEEGDAIHVLFSGTGVFANAMASVLRNTIDNAMRRCIKVQASGVEVAGNRLLYTSTAPPENPGAGIDVIQAANVAIVNNELVYRPAGGAISVTGIAGYPLEGIVVQGNRTNYRDDQSAGHIYIIYTRNAVVAGNTARGGTFAVAGGANEDLVVDSNTHYGGANAEISFRFVSSSVGTVATNNKNMNAQRPAFLRNDGTKTYSSGNYTKYVAA